MNLQTPLVSRELRLLPGRKREAPPASGVESPLLLFLLSLPTVSEEGCFIPRHEIALSEQGYLSILSICRRKGTALA